MRTPIQVCPSGTKGLPSQRYLPPAAYSKVTAAVSQPVGSNVMRRVMRTPWGKFKPAIMVGYCTTVNFAIYYMEYVFGNKDLYMVLVAVVGVAQLGSLAVYPAVAKRINRRSLYTISTILVLVGYAIFFFAELSIVLIVLGALLVFVGQAFIQALMLMFLSGTVEYGQWKLGKRNEAITFSVQPLINKLGGALATGIVSMTLILSGIKVDESTAAAIGPDGQLILKVAMFAIPLLMIIAGYIVYLKKDRITEEYYANMLKEIEALEGSGPAGKA